MSRIVRERRSRDSGGESSGGAGGSMRWLPVVLAVSVLGFGFLAWTDVKRVMGDTSKRLVDVDLRLAQIQTQIANAAKAKPAPQQGPDPARVYAIKTDGGPTRGNPTAPIVIAEFSDYQ